MREPPVGSALNARREKLQKCGPAMRRDEKPERGKHERDGEPARLHRDYRHLVTLLALTPSLVETLVRHAFAALVAMEPLIFAPLDEERFARFAATNSR